jgi:molybdopterin-guanine dinucleotide biosynthesis protein B
MIISFVGSSGSGKTTLITKVVPLLKKKGLKVAVVKHTQDFELNKEGKDSWRIYQSGADVVISSPKKLALLKRVEGENLDRIHENYLKEYDVVLTEGFNLAGKDRIVVLNDPSSIEYFKHGRILAVVSDSSVNGCVHFRKDNVKAIAEFIYGIVKGSPQDREKHAETQAF